MHHNRVMTWDLAVGDEDSRTEIQKRHRGSNARGISAPGRTTGLNDIMLWWRPEHGEGFGYLDGWTTDGTAFYFTGTGQRGDQRFEAPFAENGRVRDHVANGDHVRLLRYIGKNQVRYLGELRLDASESWKWIDGPDSTLRTRRMIQFRFLPVDDIELAASERVRSPVVTTAEAAVLPPVPPEPVATDVEALGGIQFKRLMKAREVLAERKESVLVHAFQSWLDTTLNLDSTGLRIPYRAEGRNLRADLFVTKPRILIEAKGTVARESIRMAIGQLLDYSRWVRPSPALMLLTPDRPPADMCDLLDSLDISYAWQVAVDVFEVSGTATLLTRTR